MRRLFASVICTTTLVGCHQGNATPVLTIAGVGQRHDGAISTAQFVVTQSAAARQPVTVEYATADGTALADRDYRPASGALEFRADDNTPQTVSITLLDGGRREHPVTFSVTLSHPMNAVIVTPTAFSTITAVPRSERTHAR
jgi:hypothetical protein